MSDYERYLRTSELLALLRERCTQRAFPELWTARDELGRRLHARPPEAR